MISRSAMSRIQHLANTLLLPDTCTLTRYAASDGYDPPAVLGTAADVACRFSTKQQTVQVNGGLVRVYSASVTLPKDSPAWQPPATEEEPEPEPFTSAVQVNDLVTINGTTYRVDRLGDTRLDGERLTFTAYLESGSE